MGDLRRILVVKPADLGDLLLTTPALRALRATFPHARIALFAPPRSAFLLRTCPYVDDVLTFDKYAFDDPRALFSPRGWISLVRLAWQLRRRRYDAVVIPRHLTTALGALKFAALAFATGAPIRAGLDNGRGWFLTHRVPDDGFGARHEVEYDLAVVGTLGAHTDNRQLWVPRDDAAETWAEHLVQAWPRPLVVMHPGSGGYSTARRWPAEQFAALADAWHARHGGTIVLVDAEEATTAAVVSRTHAPLVDLGGQTTLLQTIALLRRADLFVGNDSGPLHLAAGVGVPVVGVYGPSNWRAWGPWGRRTAVVHRALPCQPCFYRGHRLGLPDGCPDRPCLTMLPHEQVLAAMEQMLGG